MFHTFTFKIAAMMLTAVTLLSGCSAGPVSEEWNQKMTVVIEIDGEQYEGSGVQRLQMNYSPEYGSFHSAKTTSTQSRSEAVVIDLGEHGYMFALWPYDYPDRFAKAYPTKYLGEMPKIKGKDTSASRAKAYKTYLKSISRSKNQVTLHPDKNPSYPVLAAFKDVKNPKTIQRFHTDGSRYNAPLHDPKKLAQFYGSSARIVSVIINNTREPVTLGQLDTIFPPDYFKSWGREKLSAGGRPGCKKKYSKAYCDMTKVDFENKRLKID